MVFCLLWYGCPGLYDTCFYDAFIKLGYNYDRRKDERGPAGIIPLSKKYMVVAEINEKEFRRIFTELTTGGGIEECVRFLLKTMYPNNFKYMPIHIYICQK